MAKVSAKYEVVYIVNPTKSEEETAALVAKFTALAEQHASAVEVEEWGSASWPTKSTTRRKAIMSDVFQQRR